MSRDNNFYCYWITGACYCSSTYLAEICTPEHRGPLLSFLEPIYTFGILICNLLVHILGWRTSAYCFVGCSIVCFQLLFLLPESPSWLVTRGKIDRAAKILTWLRGCENEAEREIVEIENSMELTKRKSRSQPLSSLFMDILRSWKPLAILVGLVTLQRVCGCPILESYTVRFFDALKLPFDSPTAAIYHSTTNFATSFFTPFAVQKLSRRVLLGLTSFMMGISMLVVALYEVQYFGSDYQPYFLVVLVSVYVYDVASTLGVLPLPFIMSGELFPTENRGMMNGIYCSFSFLTSAVVVKMFPKFLTQVGIINVTFSYAFVCFVTILYGKFLLPETRGKTLPEIQAKYFKHRQEYVSTLNVD